MENRPAAGVLGGRVVTELKFEGGSITVEVEEKQGQRGSKHNSTGQENHR